MALPLIPKPLSESKRPTSWIFDSKRDLALIVATPVLILPVAFAFMSVWSSAAFVLLVAAFGQVGHILPGLLRAYGDRELFQRYRIRFVVAPILIGAICVAAVINRWQITILVGVVWAVWHALMQTYGFLRIYAAKNGVHSVTSRRLDFALCVVWFGGAILLNDQPLFLVLNRWYGSGGFMIGAWAVSGVRLFWTTALIVLTATYVGRLLLLRWRGESVSWPRLLMLVSSIGFYWYAYAGATNILVGAAMFEIFHDVQYLAIVWCFNRRRAESGDNAGRFVKFLFQNSGAFVGLYVGMVFAFGGLRLMEEVFPNGISRDVLTGILACAGILHYYYDGFIWKIRDAANSEPLELQNNAGLINVTGLKHALKWMCLAVPVALLFMAELRTERDDLQRWTMLSDSLPQCVEVQKEAGQRLIEAGDLSQASKRLFRVTKVAPNDAVARVELVKLLIQRDREPLAFQQCEQGLNESPANAELLSLSGQLLMRRRKPQLAEHQLGRALQLKNEAPEIRTAYASALLMNGKLDKAEEELLLSLTMADTPATNFYYGELMLKRDDIEAARVHFERALDLRPDFEQAQVKLESLKD